MTTVVFIETNFSGLDAIVYCRQKGYHCVLVTDSRERFKKWFPAECLYKIDLADQIIAVENSNDVAEVLSALQNQLDRIDAVLTFAEIRTRVTAQICHELGLQGASIAAIEIAQDKYRFRQVMLSSGADIVHCQRIENPQQLNEIKDTLKYPVFLKPVQGHSSIGATVCREKNDVEAVVAQLSAIAEDWISESYVVEDFLEGQLVSVEVLTTGAGQHQVVGISDRDVLLSSIEIGASFPLQHHQKHAIEAKACAALDAIGYDFGPSHIEIILTESGPHLVEVNSRVGGSGHSIMLDLATDRSIVGDSVELCLGNLERFQPLYKPAQGAAWHCFVSEQVGRIKSLPTREAIEALSGVKDVWFHNNEGDEVTSLNSNYNWIVQVMCTGVNQTAAKKNALTAIQYVAEHAVIA